MTLKMGKRKGIADPHLHPPYIRTPKPDVKTEGFSADIPKRHHLFFGELL